MTAVVGILIGFVAPKSRTLESQRADFTAVLAPITAEQASLRDRIAKLETQHAEDVAQHYRDVRRIDILTDYVKDLLAFIQLHVTSPPPPPIPSEISNDI
ncbi:hypothetical protein ACFWU5_16150 [Nocardia sp. NPDC058640]|uniref:hypothetical protein n=1 Tax=Nocardia sp. NPDC058640 TaxID=3346571 RepID=UPI0036672AF9